MDIGQIRNILYLSFFCCFVTWQLFFPCIIDEGPYLKRKEIQMDDNKIIDLYWKRSENAISETEKKYGRDCYHISFNILHNNQDCEECINDTYLKAWNTIPPKYPKQLSTFLGKIVRNLSLDLYDKYTAEKRGFGQVPLVLDELEGCIPAASRTEQAIDEFALAELLNHFLAGIKQEQRSIFVQRYWYLNSVREIAENFGISESKVKMTLLRIRRRLKQFLVEEGVYL